MKKLTLFLLTLTFALLGCSNDCSPSTEIDATDRSNSDATTSSRSFARGEFYIEQKPQVGAYARFDETVEDSQLSVGQGITTAFATGTMYGMSFDFQGADAEGDKFQVSVFLNDQREAPVFADSIKYRGEPLVFWSDGDVKIGLRPH
jgi:hypothetical protein